MRQCRDTGDYAAVFFEWYKYVATLCIAFASIQLKAPAMRRIPPLHYAVLIGSLTRVSRLMLANVTLSHAGLFGETTLILDRCIFESAIKSTWLCHKASPDLFDRFIATSLKTDLAFKKSIESKIAARHGQAASVIERRMLASIDRYFAVPRLTTTEVETARKLPDLASMIDDLGRDKLAYIVGQMMGSSHVHGTWSSLFTHYLESRDGGVLAPRDHNCPTSVNQYVFVPLTVLEALRGFVNYVLNDEENIGVMVQLFDDFEREIIVLNAEMSASDRLPAD